MAAFYSYRHVELDRVGCGKRKVLKPPGGGSSDLFGTLSSGSDANPSLTSHCKKLGMSQTGGDMADEGTSIKSMSSIDSSDGSSTPSQSSTSNGSPNSSEPNTPRSGTPLLSGPISYDRQLPTLPTPIRHQGRRVQGNPVTGEGYIGGEKKEETPKKQRVPPGGYSSKLW